MRIGLGDINTLAAAVRQVEGYFPPSAQYPNGSLAWQNNNPGNLRFAGQAGAVKACTQNNGCFAKFPTYDAGYQALLDQIQYQANQGQTLSQFINQYAPPTENNTSAYLASLQTATGATASTPLTSIIAGTPAVVADFTSTDPAVAAGDVVDLTAPAILVGGALALWYLLG